MSSLAWHWSDAPTWVHVLASPLTIPTGLIWGTIGAGGELINEVGGGSEAGGVQRQYSNAFHIFSGFGTPDFSGPDFVPGVVTTDAVKVVEAPWKLLHAGAGLIGAGAEGAKDVADLADKLLKNLPIVLLGVGAFMLHDKRK